MKKFAIPLIEWTLLLEDHNGANIDGECKIGSYLCYFLCLVMSRTHVLTIMRDMEVFLTFLTEILKLDWEQSYSLAVLKDF